MILIGTVVNYVHLFYQSIIFIAKEADKSVTLVDEKIRSNKISFFTCVD